MLGIGGATYMAVEYHGFEWLPLNGRQTISSMAIELGAKAGIFPPHGLAMDRHELPRWLYVDPEARYAQTLTIDLDALQPQIAAPHSVDAVMDLAEVAGIRERSARMMSVSPPVTETLKAGWDTPPRKYIWPARRWLRPPPLRGKLPTLGNLASLTYKHLLSRRRLF